MANAIENRIELRSMVEGFRVSELQLLLAFAGRCKTGKKQEMLARALTIIDHGCPTPVEIKIRDLHRRRFPQQAEKSVSHTSVSVPSSKSKELYTARPTSPPYYQGVPYPLDFSRSPGHHNVPVHPDVHMKSLPFYDVHAEVLRVSSLPINPAARMQDCTHTFHLTPKQVKDILASRVGDTFVVQIQVRFCLMETTCPQKDEFPPTVCLRVNGRMAVLPNPIPTNKPGVEAKRPGRPVDISSLCRLSSTAPNSISVTWSYDTSRGVPGYCVGVWVAQQLNSDILMVRLRSRGTRHRDHTTALIKEKLEPDGESEIATTSLRVNLICPLGKMRMTTPVRPTTCHHVQCFDGPTFLQMNERKPTWVCPVCDRPAEFSDLIIDGLFTHILQSVDGDCNEVTFTDDGSWRPSKRKETNKAQTAVTPIKDDAPAPKHPAPEVIDLTADDEDDNDMPVSRGPAKTPPLITLDSPSSASPLPGSSSPRYTSRTPPRDVRRDRSSRHLRHSRREVKPVPIHYSPLSTDQSSSSRDYWGRESSPSPQDHRPPHQDLMSFSPVKEYRSQARARSRSPVRANRPQLGRNRSPSPTDYVPQLRKRSPFRPPSRDISLSSCSPYQSPTSYQSPATPPQPPPPSMNLPVFYPTYTPPNIFNPYMFYPPTAHDLPDLEALFPWARQPSHTSSDDTEDYRATIERFLATPSP